jgi:hypothetical protein
MRALRHRGPDNTVFPPPDDLHRQFERRDCVVEGDAVAAAGEPFRGKSGQRLRHAFQLLVTQQLLQGLLHAGERRRPNGRGDGRSGGRGSARSTLPESYRLALPERRPDCRGAQSRHIEDLAP